MRSSVCGEGVLYEVKRVWGGCPIGVKVCREGVL